MVVPVVVLARDTPAVLHQSIHHLRRRDDLDPALDLGPAPEELVGQHAQLDPTVPPHIPHLDRFGAMCKLADAQLDRLAAESVVMWPGLENRVP
jgi:hypothetical protein